MLPDHLYQDIWIRGRVVTPGVRDCESRYEILRSFCSQFRRPFTVVDLGANLGYFSIRLAEDFDCTCVAIENSYSFMLERVLAREGNPRVIQLNHTLTRKSIQELVDAEHFDVVVAYGIIHWLPWGPAKNMEMIRKLGEHAFIEIPFESNARGGKKNYPIPADEVYVGRVRSHLTEGFRKIYYAHTPKPSLAHSYVGAKHHPHMQIESTFYHKLVYFQDKSDMHTWARGINLWTYLTMGGCYPQWQTILPLLHQIDWAGHSDPRPWNVILQGDELVTIDHNDSRWTTQAEVWAKEMLQAQTTDDYRRMAHKW